jgi:carbon monoxide dehydrogenase subunit G
MIIEQKCLLPIPVERLWDFLIDAPAVSKCMPGIEEFSEAGPDEYEGRVRIKVGPISLRLQGRAIVVERDKERWTARMKAEGGDQRIAGGVTAVLTLSLAPTERGETELNVVTNATVLGKLGEFGQPIMKKSADRIIQQFVRNVIAAFDEPLRSVAL